MKTSQNTTTILLTVTAAVLTALLAASLAHNEPAFAASASAKSGDYILVGGAYDAQSDFIYVLDIANDKLAVYRANINTNSIDIGDTVDLAKTFGHGR